MTAALGIILDIPSNTQKFFGGGQVANTAKNVANDEGGHTDDITAIAISSDRKWAASGQVGAAPAAFVWNAYTGEKKQRFKLKKGARGINAIAISNDNKYVAMVDLSETHDVYVYDIESGALVMTDKGDTNKIFDICFTAKNGDYSFATAGAKHIKFWSADSKSVQGGLYNGKGDMTSFACVAYDDNGVCYTGGANSQIYVWPTRELSSTVTVHKGGFICALRWYNGKLYSGGKDGNVCITNTSTMTVEKAINFGSLIRAIDITGSKGLVGVRDGTIYEVDINSENMKVIMESHSEGELWGIATAGNYVVTSADDNKIKTWDFT
jgi:WD40 repeat protein